MSTIARWLIRALVACLAAIAALFAFGPREPVDLINRFDPATIGPDPDAYLAGREAAFDNITPGAEKRIVWARDPGTKSDLVLIYLHGFSASPEEIRPVPDRVAAELGANLVFVRSAGHGQDGAALANASIADWVFDVDEALAVANRIGERIVVIGTSTGGTMLGTVLGTERASEIEGAIFISPNFQIKNPLARVLTMPAARTWVPVLFGKERAFETHNDGHAMWWTNTYPSAALFPMAALVEHSRSVDYGSIRTPALFVFADSDEVVDHGVTRDIAARWGGDAEITPVSPGPTDDPSQHVIAGDVLSPGMNDSVVNLMVAWLQKL